ncbi:MAG: DNA adenine methylase [SAR324 cluster bacterium]|uniref:Site-specific DNA-methyltransferase (adenine-specific) n=1 Tax=SAR324 cluster bacterium TaxID=2024889 RepID=A0A7X9FSX3_9DELT|nr:DNA adenine methylase [SAR324 cluster bacterium]
MGSTKSGDHNPRSCRPFLKWAGGKAQLLDELQRRLPKKMERYIEPFVGGGALLFSLQPQKALIIDINAELINAYKIVKHDVESLIKSLRRHVYEEDYYYSLRNADRSKGFNRWTSVRKASRLIYLNKTCFNGLYRVNSKGLFNVPFGRYTNPTIVDAENLRNCSRILKRVQIRQGSFEIIEPQIRSGDFVYFDPPYVPLNSTSYFTAYDRHGFDLKMQEALFELCCRLDKKGIPFMLSNSYSSFVKSRYKKFRVELVEATRAVNSKSDARGKINELIIRNY